jgi:phosphoserine phosphatase
MAVKIVFLDCDGTLTNVTSSWQYLHERLNLWEENADEFQRLFRAGRISYGEFCARDAALWKGLPIDRIRDILDEIELRHELKETIGVLNSAGIETVILSSGLSLLVDRVRGELGIGSAVSNELAEKDGVVTGEIRINVDHDHKGFWVRNILADRGLRKEEAAAVGDGEGDLGMFEEVGLAIGYYPSEKILPFLDHALFNGSFIDIVGMILGHR